MTMTFSTSTLKPRTSNGTHAGTEEDRTALVLDALAVTEPAPEPALVEAPAEPASPRRRKARVVEAQPAPEVSTPAPASARLDEPSDLEVLGEVALAAHAQGLTLQLYVERLTRQLDAVRRLLGAQR